jgi:N-acetylmuramic acid 6-phosphate etherase
MVEMVATNAKLRGRMISILMDATGCSEAESRQSLSAAGGDLKTAFVALGSGAGVREARDALARSADQVRAALALLT